MNQPLRMIGRWLAMFVSIITGLIALFALNVWIQTARLPYNSEGRYFDAEATIVHTDDEPQFWAVFGCTALAMSAGAGLLTWKLRRRPPPE